MIILLKLRRLPVENDISLIVTIDCVSHVTRGTPWEKGQKSFFGKADFREDRARNPNNERGLPVLRNSWDTVGQRDGR